MRDFSVGEQSSIAVIKVVVERDVRVVPLNQTAARSVVTGGGEQQKGFLAQGVFALHETLAKTWLAHHQGAVVILQGTRHNFSSAGGIAVDENDHGIFISLVAPCREPSLLLRISSVVGDDELILFEEVIGNVHRFLKQTSTIAAKIQYHPF